MSRSHRQIACSADLPRSPGGRLPWPTAVLVIVGLSLLCWFGLAALVTTLLG